MAEILGLGLTHYPPLARPDELMPGLLKWTLQDPDIPAEQKDPANWPESMRAEWGDDEGVTAAASHRARLLDGFNRCRQALDEFKPDVVLVWGDDQYENYKEDVIPAFSVLAYDQAELKPWDHDFGTPNVWNESADTEWTLKSHQEAGKYLASRLIEADLDVAYAYEPLHGGWGHAFTNTVAFLDYEREKGWDYPTLAFHVNCYGRSVIVHRGIMSRFADALPEPEMDPPSPSPDRCFKLGQETAKALRDSPWRVAIIASSSWSHAFLTDKTWRLHPDIESDRRYYDALAKGDYDAWQGVPLSDVEEAGQQEMLNWFCLVGAMSELGRTPTYTDFVETHVLNSNKCFAIFESSSQ